VGSFIYSIVLLKNFDPTFMIRSRNLAYIISLFTLWETSTSMSLNLKPVAFLTIFYHLYKAFLSSHKPTRGYKNSAKLIDNIFANRIHCKVSSGNFVSDISDQFCLHSPGKHTYNNVDTGACRSARTSNLFIAKPPSIVSVYT